MSVSSKIKGGYSMTINKADQELIDKIGVIFSDACPENVSDKEVAKILEVSEDKVKSIWKTIYLNAPTPKRPF
jgi:hypothetical protein